jgi:MraZ protein
MLTSRVNNSIDEAGRMFMPAKYCEDFDINGNAQGESAVLPAPSKLRKNYAGRCVIMHSVDRCLYAYPVQEWDRLIADLRMLPGDDDNIRVLLRHYVGSSTFCDIDKQGRLTIPQEARNYAGLVRDLACVGMIEKLEIWDRETYENAMRGKDFKELSNYVSKLKRELAQGRQDR